MEGSEHHARFAVSARTDCQQILSVSNTGDHKSRGELYILLNAARGVVPSDALGHSSPAPAENPEGSE